MEWFNRFKPRSKWNLVNFSRHQKAYALLAKDSAEHGTVYVEATLFVWTQLTTLLQNQNLSLPVRQDGRDSVKIVSAAATNLFCGSAHDGSDLSQEELGILRSLVERQEDLPGEIRSAISYCRLSLGQIFLAQQPPSPTGLDSAGLENASKAQEHFEAALKANPTNVVSMHSLAFSLSISRYGVRENSDETCLTRIIDLCEKASNIDKTYAQAFYLLGVSLIDFDSSSQPNKDKALNALRRARQLDPKNTGVKDLIQQLETRITSDAHKLQLPWAKTMKLVAKYHAANLKSSFSWAECNMLAGSPLMAMKIHLISQKESFKASAIEISNRDVKAMLCGLRITLPTNPLHNQAALLWHVFCGYEYERITKISPLTDPDNWKLKGIYMMQAEKNAADLVNRILD
jgi:tetratricopeptide (TPR) repeat protein